MDYGQTNMVSEGEVSQRGFGSGAQSGRAISIELDLGAPRCYLWNSKVPGRHRSCIHQADEALPHQKPLLISANQRTARIHALSTDQREQSSQKRLPGF